MKIPTRREKKKILSMLSMLRTTRCIDAQVSCCPHIPMSSVSSQITKYGAICHMPLSRRVWIFASPVLTVHRPAAYSYYVYSRTY
ncbi:hypothetical protein BZA77DRAFT_305639, partial [Pyronema omphalodes]